MSDSATTRTQPPADSEPAAHAAVPTPAPLPPKIGRYRVERVLGQGGFGLVYLAHDDQLHRPVAVKVPHRSRIVRPEDAEAYLAEARTVASLDHPNIVPVYDLGSTADCPCFVVTKLIEGSTLAQKLAEGRPPYAEAAAVVAAIADALHHAHCKGLVHRDVKPRNILLDAAGRPYLVDFGLALKEENLGQGPKFAGTATYMSPEQARGEGHRVDGRSDIFSLGVVLYELLAGRRPFQADNNATLFDLITSFEPRPLRQIDEEIPRELERICFKALAKRAAERYMTAKDMAEDLRQFLARPTVSPPPAPTAADTNPPSATTSGQAQLSSGAPGGSATSSARGLALASDSWPIKIVPKGLRSFDAHDADFFLELVPGPRDREGLPDSVRFWKSRIEETDPDETFSVGLIYGPSGCGKSSLVKAGLLPRLSDRVLTVYVEATANETETRLVNGLRKRCPALPAGLTLTEMLAALRRGQETRAERESRAEREGVASGAKVLIVLDQFEQWLHGKKPEQTSQLVQALRQCDGGRVQCLLMVRDDFWLAVSRFVRDLEVDLVPGRNIALVDVFDPVHARKVLAAFGQAFGKLPEKPGKAPRQTNEFLNQAVSGLAEEGKVVCVRLALFAEMMKGKPWTAASLREMGGTEGVGVSFLEETFSSQGSNPRYRLHQDAARAVLKALLPPSGADIKGHMRSETDLLAASGYAGRPRDFEDLMRILDREVRLITPTDPEGLRMAETDSGTAVHDPQAATFYQLTHDYLVHSVRDWVTRKQKETRRGRAELLLADRAAVWNARPETRQLPSFLQWTTIRLLTRKSDWTPPQRRMMRQATRYHALWTLMVLGLVLLASLAGLDIRTRVVEQNKAARAAGLVQHLLDANLTQVPAIITELEAFRPWADPLLKDENRRAAVDSPQKLHTSLALLRGDPSQVDYLYERLLAARPEEVSVLRDGLAPHASELRDRLWTVAERPAKGRESERLRAACALASYDPDSPHWEKVRCPVADDLVEEPAVYLATWMDCLRPVRRTLLAPLAAIYRDPNRPEAARFLAANILADYSAGRPQLFTDLLMDADDREFAVLYPKLKDHGEHALNLLQAEVDRVLLPGTSDKTREDLARRQGKAAVALLRSGRSAAVWPLLKHSPDPTRRSYLVYSLGPLGADARAIINRLDEETEPSVRRALVLSLGGFPETAFSPDERARLGKRLRDLYRCDGDAGLHAAAEWLLRQGRQGPWVEEMNQKWAADGRGRDDRLTGIRQALAQNNPDLGPQWYVNSQGQTLVVLPGRVEFSMGSPADETGRRDNEVLHRRRIGRSFALTDKPVTVHQFKCFRKDHDCNEEYAPTCDCPVQNVSWYLAAEYCNWLSKEEGLPESEWCYVPNEKGKYGDGMKLARNYLQRTGYRLPTEAEWEYACRAGAVTSRSFGQFEELLKEYAWYRSNSGGHSWPVGRLKPNDWGLFDMHGNVLEWCQDQYNTQQPRPGGKALEDEEGPLTVAENERRVTRGGLYVSQSKHVRCAIRLPELPTSPTVRPGIGIRVARTLR